MVFVCHLGVFTRPLLQVFDYRKSNALFYRPLRPPLAASPRRRSPAGQVGGRAPALAERGLMQTARERLLQRDELLKRDGIISAHQALSSGPL